MKARSFIAWLLLASAGCTASGRPGAVDAGSAAPSAERPILYLDVKGKCSALTAFTGAVRSDGGHAFTLPDAYSAAWAPDGSRFMAIVERDGKRSLVLFQSDGTAPHSIRELLPGAVHAGPLWAPDGKSFAMLGGRPAVLSILADDGTIKRIVRLPGGVSSGGPLLYFRPQTVRWSPDGARILIGWQTTIVVTVDSGVIETVTEAPALAEWAPSSEAVYYFSPDLSTGRRDLGHFHVKHLGKDPIRLLDGAAVASIGWGDWRGLQVGRISLSPSGARMAVVAAADKDSHVIRVYDTRAAVPLDLTRPIATFKTADLITGLEWSPNERHLAFQAIIWEPEPSAAVRLLDLASGRWTTLARVAVPLVPGCIEILTQTNLSWSR